MSAETTQPAPRFVLLHHQMPAHQPRPAHWDLMLESGEVLWTWALAEVPTPDRPTTAERLADHRTDYLEYEGPVSGGRGSVRRHDCGTYRLVQCRAGEITVELDGRLLRGTLQMVADARQADAQRWTLVLVAR